jgi:hypothetical protein
MFQFPPVDAYTPVIYYCDTMPSVELHVADPNAYSTYTWTTADGVILGPNTGSSISIRGAGTYYVHQAYHTQCQTASSDSVLILYDTACSLLPLSVTDFTATAAGNRADLKWQVTGDQMVADYSVEYSEDNIHFIAATHIPSRNLQQTALYGYSHNWTRGNAVVYYRLRITALSGPVSYSRVVPVHFIKGNGSMMIYPNPSHGDARLSVKATEKQTTTIFLYDVHGRKIGCRPVTIPAGEQSISLQETQNLPPGAYYIRIQLNGKNETAPIILQ